MAKKYNRKKNRTVHFMVTEEDMKEINRRFKMTNYKNKGDFFRDAILKTRIISIDLAGAFRKDIREIISTVSRNSGNINQIAKLVNSTGIIYKNDVENIQNALKGELIMLSDLREKASDYVINEVIGYGGNEDTSH